MTREKMTKEELRELRESLGLTQEDFARQLGLSRGYYALVEKGGKPLSEKLVRNVERVFNKRAKKSEGAISIHDIDANGAVFAVGHGAKANGALAKSKGVPDWARQLQESIDTTNALLLKILERMG